MQFICATRKLILIQSCPSFHSIPVHVHLWSPFLRCFDKIRCTDVFSLRERHHRLIWIRSDRSYLQFSCKGFFGKSCYMEKNCKFKNFSTKIAKLLLSIGTDGKNSNQKGWHFKLPFIYNRLSRAKPIFLIFRSDNWSITVACHKNDLYQIWIM